jgi:hypothetical protein
MSQVKLLSLVVRATVILLTAGAVLVVLGVFNELLHWDIFGPEAERLLRGVFASCLALGGFGAAISIVLGIHAMVTSVSRLVEQPQTETEPAPKGRWYVATLLGGLALLVLTVAGFSLADRRIEARRIEVFKLIAQEQMKQLGPKLAPEVSAIRQPCETCVTPGLLLFFHTMDGLSFCTTVTLYLADPVDETVLWRFAPAMGEEKPGMERLFIARDDDRAVKLALQGDTAWIEQKNGGPGFVWYHIIKDGQGQTRGVLRIDGNQSESFRDYAAVAEAAQKR